MKKQHPVSERGDVLHEPGNVLHSTPAHPSLAVQGTSGPARPHVPVQAGPSSKVSEILIKFCLNKRTVDGILNTTNHVRFTKVPFKPLFLSGGGGVGTLKD